MVFILFTLYSLGLLTLSQEEGIYVCMKHEKNIFMKIFIVNIYEGNLFPMQKKKKERKKLCVGKMLTCVYVHCFSVEEFHRFY